MCIHLVFLMLNKHVLNSEIMKQIVLYMAIQGLFICSINAQDNVTQIPMDAAHWTSTQGEVEFTQHKSVDAMRILSRQELMVARDVVFRDGTIEFDVALENTGFSFYFRRDGDVDSESIYLRAFQIGNPTAPDLIQYTAVTNGVLLWNVHGHYQGNADHKAGEWNHVKIVVSGRRMLLYMNDMEKPALTISNLESNSPEGGIAFEAESIIANVVIKHDQIEGLSGEPEFDITEHDPRYLRDWQVSEPFVLPFGHELVSANRNLIAGPHLPSDNTSWSAMSAERLGLVNLSRRFGANTERRAVWLRVKLIAEEAQMRYVDFGFLDEVWVILNDQLVYVDKNIYNNPIMKEPAGRLSVENTSFPLPLRPGENELLIGIASNFWSWGIIARLDKNQGIKISP